MSVSQDRERREDELNELRHILDENHAAVISWESDCREKAKVHVFKTLKTPHTQNDKFVHCISTCV